MPNKLKIIGEIKIPEKYFFDFFEGLWMVIEALIHSGIKGGNRVLCFTPLLYQQAKNTLIGCIR